ncbi:Transcriptional repressor / ROK family [[Mycoplasma] cavipharyngis]|uniref:ROK family protein n=1 Tax=[Mycoplasma] cavipharyngis TaxID=92757 RepID=UPI003703ACE8
MNQIKHKYGSIDIGGTNVRFALIDNNQIVFFQKFHVDQNSPLKTLTPVFDLIKKYQVNVLGVACPGPANYEQGIIIDPPNLQGWHHLNLKQLIFDSTGIDKVVFENDANAAALAVHYHFKQTEKDTTQFFTISTGLGAGLIYRNQIFVGYNHLAQEIAKVPLAPFDTDQVFHLSPHALELFASGTGIVNRAKTLGLNLVTPQAIFANYDQNLIAKQIIDEAIVTLSHLFATSMAFFAPNLIVIGGSMGIHNQWFVRKAFDQAKLLTWSNQYQQVRLEFDSLGDNLVLLGLNHLIHAKYN